MQLRRVDENSHQRGIKIDILARGEPDRLALVRISAMQQDESYIFIARITENIFEAHHAAFLDHVEIAAAHRSVDLNGKMQARSLSEQVPENEILKITVFDVSGDAARAIFCVDGCGAGF